jgi:hypothetical protein
VPLAPPVSGAAGRRHRPGCRFRDRTESKDAQADLLRQVWSPPPAPPSDSICPSFDPMVNLVFSGY